MKLFAGSALGAVVALSLGCGAGVSECEVTPAEWSAPEWEANTGEAMALRTRLSGLTGADLMRGAETGAVNASVDDLNAAYEGGTPSLASVTTPWFDGLRADAFGEFVEAVGAGEQDLVDDGGAWTPGADGGVWTTKQRAFNEAGLEVRQLLDKGLFGGASLYNYALGLTTGEITPATVDAIAAAFGSNPGLNPGRSDDAVEANRNAFSANYVYRMGHFADAREALIAAKAYAGDETCTAERDEALQTFFATWERGLFARFVYYANEGATAMAAATTDDERNGALHELAEGLGLAIGFYGVPTPATGPLSGTTRGMTDARISTALAAVGISVDGDLGDATTYTFVTDTTGFSAAVADVEAEVAAAYGLTAEQVAAYRTPSDG